MDLIGRMLGKIPTSKSKVYWERVGLIGNIASSQKMTKGGKKAKFTTATSVTGRKITKFLKGKDMRTKLLVAPCAVSALDEPARSIQGARVSFEMHSTHDSTVKINSKPVLLSLLLLCSAL